MTMQRTIESKISASLKPSHLEVIKQRHQKVNRLLAAELKDRIHALSMETLTAAEWRRRGGKTLASPPCHGGSKAEA
ncbi:MAG: BolA/IbaG family iron-sulfur metabolism protein [Rhodospirillales bacterium]|nr:BolA/IbaG family iron-sulfur metabolism protein [Rhodospirillales bacterium]